MEPHNLLKLRKRDEAKFLGLEVLKKGLVTTYTTEK